MLNEDDAIDARSIEDKKLLHGNESSESGFGENQTNV